MPETEIRSEHCVRVRERMSLSMHTLFESFPSAVRTPLIVLLGTCVGTWLTKWIVRLADEQPLRPPLACAACGRPFPGLWRLPVLGWLCLGGRCRVCRVPVPRWYCLLPLATGLVFGVYTVLAVDVGCQRIEQVSPDTLWKQGRVCYHLLLITLLIAATGTDLRHYVVPDAVTVTGAVIGVAGAVISGDLQMVHLWIDWNKEAIFVGAYIPDWVVNHRHWHGLAWSLAGVVAGGGITWALRWLSRFILGAEALGFGDVTLMAMIGSFVGWQPVLFILLLAPLTAVVVAVAVGLTGRQTYIPYGPFLSGAAFVVLCSWRWLWQPTRYVFGHWPSLLGLAAVALGGLSGLLLLARMYRAIPVEPTKRQRAAWRATESSSGDAAGDAD